MAEQHPASGPAGKWKSRIRRALKRLAVLAMAIYLIVGIVLYFIQPVLIFPGAYVHRQDGIVPPSADYEFLHLHTPEGHQIAAVFGIALDASGTPVTDPEHRPTILFLYGNGDCIATSMGAFRRFRELGANVLIPEYIGYPTSEGKPSDVGCCQTADAAFAYLLSRPDIDHAQIVVVLRSIGSGPAIDLASRKPVAALVTISAFTSLDEMAHKVVPIYPACLVLRAHFNNAGRIATVRCPILLTHGTTDTFVPYSMMSYLARSATAPVSIYSIDKADHNNVFQVSHGRLFHRIGEFIKANLPAPDEKQSP
jgi:fermentation-respiration switch protein FrsA (DUF1100 family)